MSCKRSKQWDPGMCFLDMSRVQRLRYGMQMMTDLLGGNGIGMVPMRKWLYNQHWGSDSQLKRQQQSGMSVSISRVQTTGWRYR